MAIENFKGCPYPIAKHPLGLLHKQWGVNQIKSDLLILLLTNPGERIMLPLYGTPLRRLFFEPNDTIIVTQARQMIIDSIKTWEPRVAIEAIEVTMGTDSLYPNDWGGEDPPTNSALIGGDYSDARNDDDHALSVRISFFDPEDIQSVQELVLQIPLS